ncbi:uncharacterized protein LOC104848453 [Fukomys damarensis]|uniref:uncharacterized protein LOC104848453 n=1 Tax=Fukomys damarensis TaxID=885580 RepID=UPI00053F8258|nr:uncharacterized protein LOC104848453 [Fukomys damarensis]
MADGGWVWGEPPPKQCLPGTCSSHNLLLGPGQMVPACLLPFCSCVAKGEGATWHWGVVSPDGLKQNVPNLSRSCGWTPVLEQEPLALRDNSSGPDSEEGPLAPEDLRGCETHCGNAGSRLLGSWSTAPWLWAATTSLLSPRRGRCGTEGRELTHRRLRGSHCRAQLLRLAGPLLPSSGSHAAATDLGTLAFVTAQTGGGLREGSGRRSPTRPPETPAGQPCSGDQVTV